MRIDWDSYFMGKAFICALRSHDEESKVGAIIVKDNRELGMGYNGFPRGLNDKDKRLECSRPNKYKFMVHAEENAIANAGKTDEAVVYVTRMPCNKCAKNLWQNGIKKWIIPHSVISQSESLTRQEIKNYTQDDYDVLDVLLSYGLEIRYIDFSYDKFVESLSEYSKYFNYLN